MPAVTLLLSYQDAWPWPSPVTCPQSLPGCTSAWFPRVLQPPWAGPEYPSSWTHGCSLVPSTAGSLSHRQPRDMEKAQLCHQMGLAATPGPSAGDQGMFLSLLSHSFSLVNWGSGSMFGAVRNNSLYSLTTYLVC